MNIITQMAFLFKKNIYNLIFPLIALLFFLLLAKNPYSHRNLIANLEPFPDAEYYTTIPRCFLNGQSWKMCRLNNLSLEGVKPAVPPAYSLALIPAYLFNSDVRNFYFINIILAFTSLFLLNKILNTFFKNKVIIGVVLFFYVTNYFIYWYPTLAMAENLFLPLFLTSILLLQNSVSRKKSFLVGIVSAGFYATKYAFAPLTVIFPIIYLAKLFSTKESRKEKLIQFSLAVVPLGLILINLVGIKQVISVVNEVSNGALDTNSSAKVSSGNGYFSISYFSEHIKKYSHALLGKSQKFLWDITPLVAKWIALPGLLGLIAGFKNKKHSFAKIWLVAAIIFQLLFMSTFYVVDIRYVYHFLPTLLLGFGFYLQLLSKSILKNKNNFFAFITMILIVYLGSNAMRLKSAVMINLKYTESPWWYLSQLEMNRYFDSLEKTSQKPILITLSSPFLVDNYSNQNYKVLPLDNQQNFRGNMPEVWGPNNYSNLIELYKEKINSNQKVFITNYGVHAPGHLKYRYKEIQDNFNFIQVQSGCHDLCNIYKLEI